MQRLSLTKEAAIEKEKQKHLNYEVEEKPVIVESKPSEESHHGLELMYNL